MFTDTAKGGAATTAAPPPALSLRDMQAWVNEKVASIHAIVNYPTYSGARAAKEVGDDREKEIEELWSYIDVDTDEHGSKWVVITREFQSFTRGHLLCADNLADAQYLIHIGVARAATQSDLDGKLAEHRRASFRDQIVTKG